MKTLPLLLLLAVLPVLPCALPAQETGTVEGTLAIRNGPARRWASRYPGAGASSSQVHEVPAIVYLEGDLPAGSPSGETVTIRQEDGHFVPAALAVRTGTVVRFPNADPYYHNVFSYSGPRFDLGRYAPGESREVVLDEPGIVRTYCEIHEFMRAVVVVTDHGFHAVVGDDGRFSIAGVPPGSYTLRSYHPDLGSTATPVTVQGGATATVALELGG